MTDKNPLVIVSRETLEIALGAGGLGQASARQALSEAISNQHMDTKQIAEFAAQAHLDSLKAGNYVSDTYTIDSVEAGKFEISVRVQRVDGITPEQRAETAEAALAETRKVLSEMERALAGMLYEFDDGVNGGRDERVAAMDYARTLVLAEEFKA